MERPQRWDVPFGPEMTDAHVKALLDRPEFSMVDASRFPAHVPLAGILKNDTRLVDFQAGDIVVRERDYGNSAFLVLKGKLRVAAGLPEELLGRQATKKKSFLEAVSQLWANSKIPEARGAKRGLLTGLRRSKSKETPTRAFLQDIPVILDQYRTAEIGEGVLFGELAALGRVPRTATVFAEGEAKLLEIRWQGLRELRRFDDGWKKQIDERYRANALKTHLRETPFFEGLDAKVLQEIADRTLFETYGAFDWNVSYKQLRSQGQRSVEHEPLIAREGDYPDGLLLIRAGFARVSVKLGNGERTLTYLGAGDFFGRDELYDSWKSGTGVSLQTSLHALGYVDILRVPANILEKHVFPKVPPPHVRLIDLAAHPLEESALGEWAIEERFNNATQAMLIDLDRCTRCDDCVRACASTHGGNPRFVRHGKTFDHWMVTNACMHCADPVCMIGCPTGAIHRTTERGLVVINDDTCIGCQTCAHSCPYDNIVMVAINDRNGGPLLDPETRQPVLKATKCDLCVDQWGGPACVRACPHEALARVDFKAIRTRTREKVEGKT